MLPFLKDTKDILGNFFVVLVLLLPRSFINSILSVFLFAILFLFLSFLYLSLVDFHSLTLSLLPLFLLSQLVSLLTAAAAAVRCRLTVRNYRSTFLNHNGTNYLTN